MAELEMSPERKRLLELSRDRNVSLSKLSEMLGRNAAYLQQFIKRGTPRKLEEGDRRKLAQFFGIFEGELGADGEKSYTNVNAGRTADFASVPRLDIGASAGPGAMPAGESEFDVLRFSRRWLAEQGLENAQLSLIRVQGDSMEPLLNDKDEILVDRTQRPFRDGIHVIRLGDTLMVKRVASAGGGRLSLLSQNLAYPPVTVSVEDVEIVGRVVWKSGRM
ncbi:S24 family peptidase [Erythrobacter ani]|uniref:S24 family peptidase n=1 Tax=Erythrobacter ani TaxID=2827235 RepID=A0ABS6SNL7_9SPHN|nr:S24 family peptidase [Erythrobacter ani]MBV7266620.1 S24 family peptidase [Erythrobacter ani]